MISDIGCGIRPVDDVNVHGFVERRRHYAAFCISPEPEDINWKIPEIPFYCLSEPIVFPRDGSRKDQKTRERIEYLADSLNRCYTIGLEKFPDTTHILNTGSYYLHQTEATRQLIQRYEELNSDVILAGNVWGKFENPLFTRFSTYDTWAFPELEGMRWVWNPPEGLVQVESVGLPCIFPVNAWRDHPYHNPDDLVKDGIWYNQFCREAGLPVFVDLDVRFYRDKKDSAIQWLGYRKEFRIFARRWRRRLFRLS